MFVAVGRTHLIRKRLLDDNNMLQNASQNASECFKMLQTAANCFKMLQQIWRVKPNWSTTLTDDDWMFSRTIRAASRILLLLQLLLDLLLILLAQDSVGGRIRSEP